MIGPFTGFPILQAIGPVVAIVLLDLALSGDNVLVIGAAVARLPAQQQRLGIILGGGTALILRIVLTGFTSLLLRIPLLQAIGGLILIGVTVQLLVAHSRQRVLEAHSRPAPTDHVVTGALTVPRLLGVLLPAFGADVSTSLDNILAIGALARGNVPVLIAGLTLSMGILLGGSLAVAELIRRMPDLLELSALILAWLATQLLLGDGYLGPLLARSPQATAGVMAAVFGIVIGTGAWLRIRRQRSLRELLARLRTASARWRWWFVGLALVAGTGGGVMYLLFLVGGTNDPSLRVEIVRTGLTVSAGTGGAVALGLNLRRQWHVENEAAEKQVTELYSKGVDQLASESAAARLGGLYALERLGQLHSGHRQTIVHFICAYLRMPYTLPPEHAAGPDELAKQLEARQELQVRRAAQLILCNHLRPHRRGLDDPVDGRSGRDALYWGGMRLDLTGATLIDFDLSDCRFDDATFVRATFLPRPRSAPDNTAARFERTVFHEDVTFEGSTFAGDAAFDGAEFEGTVTFDWAKFSGGDKSIVNFQRVRFGREASFSEVQHWGRILFDDAVFERSATFVGDFKGEVRFMRTTFEGEVEFPERFERTARFNDAKFMSIARFPRTTFMGDAYFEDVTFGQDADFDNATFERSARFGRAKFDAGARFGSADFRGDAGFDEAVAVDTDGHHLPDGWRLARGSDGTWVFHRRG